MAGRHLPQAGKSGGYVKPAKVFQIISLKVVFWMRARANHAHIALENVVELRQFINAVLAQKTSQTGDARIVSDLKSSAIAFIHVHQVAFELICINAHGTEFVAAEFAPFAAYTPRFVEYWPRRIKFYGDGAQQHDRRGKHQRHDADKKIH